MLISFHDVIKVGGRCVGCAYDQSCDYALALGQLPREIIHESDKQDFSHSLT